MKNLFLTGPIGSGKSTSIAKALGEYLPKAGGFLTVRQLDHSGRAVAYWLKRPDGSDGQIIIDYSAKPYTMHMEVFEHFGVELLEKAQDFDFVILDEIGGFEVLSDVFMEALMKLLQSGVLNPATIASLYGVPEAHVKIIPYPVVNAIKITIPRCHPSGALEDDDIYGCQQHMRLANLEVTL